VKLKDTDRTPRIFRVSLCKEGGLALISIKAPDGAVRRDRAEFLVRRLSEAQ